MFKPLILIIWFRFTKMKKILYLILLIIIVSNVNAQETKIDFLPTGLNFFTAARKYL